MSHPFTHAKLRRGGIYLELPFPPSVNHYYGQGFSRKTGRRWMYLTAAARKYRESCCLLVAAAQANRGFTVPLCVAVDLFQPSSGGDVDNGQKALLDALQHAGVYMNDKLVEMLLIRKHLPLEPKSHGVCVVRIEKMGTARLDVRMRPVPTSFRTGVYLS